MLTTSSSTEIVIIGAGPIGIEMACALKRAKANYRHFEAGTLAATIAWYAPGTSIFSSPERIAIAGYPFSVYPQSRATREDYLEYLRGVVNAEKLLIELGKRVSTVKKQGDIFTLSLTASQHGVGGSDHLLPTCGETIELVTASKLIFAIGNMHVANRLNVPGEHLPHVSHYFREPHEYYGKRVLIVGAKNSAAEAAVRLARMHVQVTVVTRGEGFEVGRIKPWLYPEVISYSKEKRISLLPNSNVAAISDKTVSIATSAGMEIMQVDQVLLLTGYAQDTSLLEQLGVQLLGPNRTPEINLDSMETNVYGAFLLGTAAAGTERGHVTSYIETSHIQIPRVLNRLGISGTPPFAINAPRNGETVET